MFRKSILLTLLSTLTLFYGVAMAAPTKQYVVIHKKGSQWPAKGLSFKDPIAQEHGKYFGNLYSKGLISQGGPFPGKSGGMMIFKEGLTEKEVKDFATNDPAVKKKVMDFEIKLWMRVFGK